MQEITFQSFAGLDWCSIQTINRGIQFLRAIRILRALLRRRMEINLSWKGIRLRGSVLDVLTSQFLDAQRFPRELKEITLRREELTLPQLVLSTNLAARSGFWNPRATSRALTVRRPPEDFQVSTQRVSAISAATFFQNTGEGTLNLRHASSAGFLAAPTSFEKRFSSHKDNSCHRVRSR